VSGQLFVDALMFNRTILTLDINFNDATAECCRKIADLLQRNNSPKSMPIAPISFPQIVLSELSKIEHAKVLHGGNGTVRQVMFNGRMAALKQPRTAQALNPRDRAKFMKELDITYRVRHPACVTMYGACTDDDNMFLLMEWMEGGSLYDALGSNIIRPLLPRLRVSMARDISDGLQFLHRSGIVHRDIKSLNVLLSSDGRAKLCDFGLATLNTLTTTTTATPGRQACGTYAWSAPEVMLNGQKHSQKSDMYSFGIIMWELLTCEVPYDECDYAQIMARLRNQERPDIPNPLPSGFPPAYIELMKRCLHQVMT
jgi:serine/threonine protein kinase